MKPDELRRAWDAAQPIADTEGEAHLFRLVDPRINLEGPDIRFERARSTHPTDDGPAILLALRNDAGALVGLQRIPLAPEAPRAVLGSRHGLARVSASQDALLLAVGLENALAASMFAQMPASVAVDYAALASADIPANVRRIAIAYGPDVAGSGAAAAHELLERVWLRHRVAALLPTPRGHLSFLDLLDSARAPAA